MNYTSLKLTNFSAKTLCLTPPLLDESGAWHKIPMLDNDDKVSHHFLGPWQLTTVTVLQTQTVFAYFS